MSNNQNNQASDDFPRLDLEQGKGWGGSLADWLKRNSSLILATVIIIVLAGGIYVYTQNNQNQPFLLQDDEDIAQKNESEQLPEQLLEEPEDLTVVADDDKEIIGTGGPENNNVFENDEFIETAEKGQGVTHLARKALKRYLEKNPVQNLKPEHKIYIEDYLKIKTGNELLEIGDKKSFSKELIQKAVQKAQNLSENQIAKISPYVPLVPNL